MDSIRHFFRKHMDVEVRDDLERRLRLAVKTTICHWLMLKHARKNEKKIIQKRLPLLRLEDGYMMQHIHLCTQDTVSSDSSLHHDTIGA